MQGQKQIPVAVLMSRKPNSRKYLIPSGRYHIPNLVCRGRWESTGGRRRVQALHMVRFQPMLVEQWISRS